MSEIDKKELARSFNEKVEIHPEEKEDGSLIKSVTFRFPIFKGKDKLEEADINSRTNGKHVETVVLLSKKTEKPKTFFDISVEAKDYYRIKDRKKN